MPAQKYATAEEARIANVERQRVYREARKRIGRCVRCPKRISARSVSRCDDCLELAKVGAGLARGES